MTDQPFPASFQKVIDRFTAWALDRPDIRAAQILGSWARGEGDPLFSDLDIDFYTTRPFAYRRNWDWINEIVPAWMLQADDTLAPTRWSSPRPFSSWIVFATLENGVAVDYHISSAWELLWRDLTRFGRTVEPPLPVKILFDKDGRLARTGAVYYNVAQRIEKPNEAHFTYTLHDIWGAADRAVRKLGRGDIYDAKYMCDVGMKKHLMPLLLWHGAIERGWDRKPPYRYRYPERWADARAVAVWPQLYARYDRDDIARAIRVQLALVRELGPEIAAALGYPYAEDRIAALHSWITGTLDQIAGPPAQGDA